MFTRRKNTMRKWLSSLLMVLFTVYGIMQFATSEAQAKTLDSRSAENIFFYVNNNAGEKVLLRVMTIDELHDELSHSQDCESGDKSGDDYFVSYTDNLPTYCYRQGVGFTLYELAEYVGQTMDAPNLAGVELTFAGNDRMSFIPTDAPTYAGNRWTYNDLYGVERYYFEDLYNYWTADDFETKLGSRDDDYYNDSAEAAPKYFTPDKNAVFATGVPMKTILMTESYSDRIGNLKNYIDAHQGITNCLAGALERKESMSIGVTQTEQGMRTGERTASINTKWIYQVDLDMANDPIISAEAVAAPTCDVSVNGNIATVTLACVTPGAVIYHNLVPDGEGGYIYQSPAGDGTTENFGVMYPYTGPMEINITGLSAINIGFRAVKEGCSDAGLQNVTYPKAAPAFTPGLKVLLGSDVVLSPSGAPPSSEVWTAWTGAITGISLQVPGAGYVALDAADDYAIDDANKTITLDKSLFTTTGSHYIRISAAGYQDRVIDRAPAYHAPDIKPAPAYILGQAITLTFDDPTGTYGPDATVRVTPPGTSSASIISDNYLEKLAGSITIKESYMTYASGRIKEPGNYKLAISNDSFMPSPQEVAIIVVSELVPVSGVSLDKSGATVVVGGTEQLTATVAPADATNREVSWRSDNTAVATVSSSGLVTAVAPGSAAITVTTADGGFTATCAVTVEDRNAPVWTGGGSLTAVISGDSVQLSWSGATDNVEVTAYKIYQGTTLKTEEPAATTSYTVTGLTPGTYTFKVEAGDAAGNWSTNGPSMAVFLYDVSKLNTVAGKVYTDPLPEEINLVANTTLGTDTVQFKVEIPAGVTITAPAGWNGVIQALTVQDKSSVTITPDSGNTATINTVLEIGFGDLPLTFDKAVRILISGQAGKDVGYSRGGVFTEITTTLDEDSQEAGDALPSEGDGKIDADNGNDLVIWTKHFTKFVTYTQTPVGSDTTKPSWRNGKLTASNVGRTELTLNWSGADDNVGVTEYKLYQGETLVSTVPASESSHKVTELSAGTEYTFTVQAVDAAGNQSTDGPSVDVTTASPGPGGGGGGGGGPSAVRSTTGTAMVPPGAGGTISLGDEATIVIPANALQGSRTVEVKIEKVDQPPAAPAGFRLAGAVYEFSVGDADSYSFAKKVTIKISFDPDSIAAGETPTLQYYDQAQAKWVDIGGSVSGNLVTAQVDHFTQFAVMAAVEEAGGEEPPEVPTEAFKDITGHWAANNINELVALGAIAGYPDGSFKPDNTITRAEFATVLAKAFKLEPQSGRVFADTAGHWARDYIAVAAAGGIVSGYDDTTFGPDDLITREQMAVMIVKAAGLSPAAGETSFADSGSISVWAREAMATAAEKGIMSGYPDNTVRPQGSATRAEAVTTIWNALNP